MYTKGLTKWKMKSASTIHLRCVRAIVNIAWPHRLRRHHLTLPTQLLKDKTHYSKIRIHGGLKYNKLGYPLRWTD